MKSMKDEAKTKEQLADELNALREEVATLRSNKPKERHAVQLERMAAGLAHNFNNVLTAVLGYSHLGMKAEQSDLAKQRYFVQIAESAERLATMTDMLLAYAGRQIRQPVSLNLNDLLTDLQAPLRGVVGRDVDVKSKFDAELGLICADPKQVENVILNVVRNSYAAMTDGEGTLAITSENVVIDDDCVVGRPSAESGRYAMIAIHDDGIGMSDDVVGNAFDPFFSTKEIWEAAGMGLAVCKGIVEQNGGFIDIESERGTGTTVRVYLPQTGSVKGVARPVKRFLASGNSARTVMLMDDQPDIMDLASRVLREHGYTVLRASNEDESIDVARRHMDDHIDLLLTSLVKPFVNGDRLTKRFRKLHPETKTKHIYDFANDFVGESVVRRFDPVKLMASVREAMDE